MERYLGRLIWLMSSSELPLSGRGRSADRRNHIGARGEPLTVRIEHFDLRKRLLRLGDKWQTAYI
jgi:hypothetical protein